MSVRGRGVQNTVQAGLDKGLGLKSTLATQTIASRFRPSHYTLRDECEREGSAKHSPGRVRQGLGLKSTLATQTIASRFRPSHYTSRDECEREGSAKHSPGRVRQRLRAQIHFSHTNYCLQISTLTLYIKR